MALAPRTSKGNCHHNHSLDKSKVLEELNGDYQRQRQMITNLVTQTIQSDHKYNEAINLILCLRKLDYNYKKYIQFIKELSDKDNTHQRQPQEP